MERNPRAPSLYSIALSTIVFEYFGLKYQFYFIHFKQFDILLDNRIFGSVRMLRNAFLSKRIQISKNRQTTDYFGYQSE